MIQSKSSEFSSSLFINKFSVLTVCIIILFFWMKIFFAERSQNDFSSKNNMGHQDRSDEPKLSKTSLINPFLRSHNETVTNDSLPTVTTLQSKIPGFLSLKLKLHGVVFVNNKDSYAMVSLKNAIQEIVVIHDEISEGLYLTKIEKNQITVNYFGEEYVLKIEAKTQTQEINVIESNYDVEQFEVENLDIDKRRNPIRLFMIRRPFAVYNKGVFQGYKIMPGSNEDQFKRLGFKSGDIITYLNGVTFTGPGMKEFVIQQLTYEMNIDLIVKRGNQELSINYGF